jgi:nicotinamide mononucleotide transporter
VAAAPAVTTLEIVAALILLVSVVLSAIENIWSWPTAIAGVALYVVVFYHAKLYADMGLQFIYIAISVYGWYEWLHGGDDAGALRVSRTPVRTMLLGCVAAAAFTLILGLLLRRLTDAALPFADAGLTSFSLLAQFLMARKYIENWYIWITVDVFYIVMFIVKKLYPTSVLYAAFIAACVLGLVQWRRAAVAPASDSAAPVS